MMSNIFDHKILQNNRDRSIARFQNSNFIHQLVSDLILEIILEQKPDFNNILEIGAMDDSLSKKIKQKFPKSNLFSTEISPKWAKLDNSSQKVIMNDEFISFKENSFN